MTDFALNFDFKEDLKAYAIGRLAIEKENCLVTEIIACDTGI